MVSFGGLKLEKRGPLVDISFRLGSMFHWIVYSPEIESRESASRQSVLANIAALRVLPTGGISGTQR